MDLFFSGFQQRFCKEGHPFVAHIYPDATEVPEGFNVAHIRLDASEHSPLKWDIQCDFPLILWELDFAFHDEVLTDEARYLSLELAVEHFTKTIWPTFEQVTFGVILYRGYFQEMPLDALKLLASHLPQSVRPFLLLDTDAIADEYTYFRLLNQAVFGSFIPILKGRWAEKYPYAFPALAWDHPYSPLGVFSTHRHALLSETRIPIAVLLPEKGEFSLPQGIFRMIPEQILTHEWEGVDQLIVTPSSIDERCRRKLNGFVAAGGSVIAM